MPRGHFCLLGRQNWNPVGEASGTMFCGNLRWSGGFPSSEAKLAFLRLVGSVMKVFHFATSFLMVTLMILSSWQGVQAATTLALSPTSGPLSGKITAKGSDFGTSERVDVYFDMQSLASWNELRLSLKRS